MGPDQIVVVKAVADILAQVGTWPIGTVLLVAIIGPWVFAYLDSRAQEKRIDQMAKMYENNVQLVKDYKDLVDGYKQIVEGQQELIIHTTQIMTSVKTIAENNLYCPMVRQQTQESKNPRG